MYRRLICSLTKFAEFAKNFCQVVLFILEMLGSTKSPTWQKLLSRLESFQNRSNNYQKMGSFRRNSWVFQQKLETLLNRSLKLTDQVNFLYLFLKCIYDVKTHGIFLYFLKFIISFNIEFYVFVEEKEKKHQYKYIKYMFFTVY